MTDVLGRLMLALFVIAPLVGVSRAAPAQSLPLAHVKDIPIGRATGRFDYTSLDAKTGLLFVADLAGGRVVVIDVRKDRLVGTIGGTPSVHGVLAVPALGRVFASATGVHQTVAIDESSLQITGRAPSGRYPARSTSRTRAAASWRCSTPRPGA
jgi:hypothetical protein